MCEFLLVEELFLLLLEELLLLLDEDELLFEDLLVTPRVSAFFVVLTLPL